MMTDVRKPFVSFCISTYNRPQLLLKQIKSLLQQSFTNFEIIISDNDPNASSMQVVESVSDDRVRYFQNHTNLGMVKSFNKSIERSTADLIVMVTDDDPIDADFLSFFHPIILQNPDYSIYCGFKRKGVAEKDIEKIIKENFISEILDVEKTPDYIWSSCIMKKQAVMQIGGMPDYGSPTLADGAMIALAGSVNGGIVVNKMFSHLFAHSQNFTRYNIELFENACKGFYEIFKPYFKNYSTHINNEKVVVNQLKHWLFLNYYVLQKHYAVKEKNKTQIKTLHTTVSKILNLPYMQQFKREFILLRLRFSLLKYLYILRNKIIKYNT